MSQEFIRKRLYCLWDNRDQIWSSLLFTINNWGTGSMVEEVHSVYWLMFSAFYWRYFFLDILMSVFRTIRPLSLPCPRDTGIPHLGIRVNPIFALESWRTRRATRHTDPGWQPFSLQSPSRGCVQAHRPGKKQSRPSTASNKMRKPLFRPARADHQAEHWLKGEAELWELCRGCPPVLSLGWVLCPGV